MGEAEIRDALVSRFKLRNGTAIFIASGRHSMACLRACVYSACMRLHVWCAAHMHGGKVPGAMLLACGALLRAEMCDLFVAPAPDRRVRQEQVPPALLHLPVLPAARRGAPRHGARLRAPLVPVLALLLLALLLLLQAAQRCTPLLRPSRGPPSASLFPHLLRGSAARHSPPAGIAMALPRVVEQAARDLQPTYSSCSLSGAVTPSALFWLPCRRAHSRGGRRARPPARPWLTSRLQLAPGSRCCLRPLLGPPLFSPAIAPARTDTPLAQEVELHTTSKAFVDFLLVQAAEAFYGNLFSSFSRVLEHHFRAAGKPLHYLNPPCPPGSVNDCG